MAHDRGEQSEPAKTAGDELGASEASSMVAAEPIVGRWRYTYVLTFAVFFGAGVWLIAGQVLQPWSSAFTVLAYSFYLGARRHKLPLTGETKDSAYYLGFSLNLVFLLVAFNAYGLRVAVNDTAVQYLIRSLSSAMVATITGLICRYALYTLDDDELVQKELFSELQQEMKKSAAGFRQNQRALAQSISSFIEDRNRLAKREQKANAQYLDRIEALLTTLQTIQTSHVEAINASIKAIEPATEMSLRQIRQINDEFDKLRQALITIEFGKTLGDARNSLAAFDGSAAGANKSLNSLSESVERARKQLAEMATAAPAIRDDLGAIDSILQDFVDVIRERITELQ